MGARTNTHITAPAKQTARKLVQYSRNRSKKTAAAKATSRTIVTVNGSDAVSGKLEALKSLIPTQNRGNVNADQLFEQTANYILLLRTQVSILQELVEFYEAADTSNASTSTTKNVSNRVPLAKEASPSLFVLPTVISSGTLSDKIIVATAGGQNSIPSIPNFSATFRVHHISPSALRQVILLSSVAITFLWYLLASLA